MAECTCHQIKLNGKPTGRRNWNPDCPEHPDLFPSRCNTCGVIGPYYCTLGNRCENKLRMEGKEY